jgi:hypothetical protein
MKWAALLSVLTLNCWASVDLSQRLDGFALLANKTSLSSTELAALQKSFRFTADYPVFQEIQKRKRVFSSNDMKVVRAYDSLVITKATTPIIAVDFSRSSDAIVINGKTFKYNREAALTPQLLSFLNSQKTASFLWLKALWPEANAQSNTGLSEEMQAVVSLILASSQPYLAGQFAAKNPQLASGAVLSQFNGKAFVKNSPLSCTGGTSSGTIDLNILGTTQPLHFQATTQDDAIRVAMKIGNSDRTFTEVIKVDARTPSEVACQFANARLFPVNIAAMRPALRDSFTKFAQFMNGYLYNLQAGAPPLKHDDLPPILKACPREELNNPQGVQKCISDVCQNENAVDFNLKSYGFDMGMFPTLSSAKEQYDRAQNDLISAIATVPPSEMARGSSFCVNQQNLESCRISNDVLINHPNVSVANANFGAQYQALQAQVVPYQTAVNFAMLIANAAHACCLDSPECPKNYNAAIAGGGSGHGSDAHP